MDEKIVLQVAHIKDAQPATPGLLNATTDATFSVKVLARQILERNKARNHGATESNFTCNVDEKDNRFADVSGLADLYGLTVDELKTCAGANWITCATDKANLQALAQALVTRKQREQGFVPLWWTATTICAACGPVPVWPECPSTVMACPWCMNRRTGAAMPMRETDQ